MSKQTKIQKTQKILNQTKVGVVRKEWERNELGQYKIPGTDCWLVIGPALDDDDLV